MRDPNHLTPEKDGRFCKRVRGVLHHFGAAGDRDLALREWLAAKDDLLAGRKLRRVRPGSSALVTVKRLCDVFLTDCIARVDAGKLAGGTYDDYFRACDEFAAAVGHGRDPADLTPEDFAAVRRRWVTGTGRADGRALGPWALDRHVQAVRTMFNHAAGVARLIDRQPWYGAAFGKSSEAEKRAAARKRERERGERIFTADELAVILEAATGQLRAMVLLALNGGMYAKDVAALRQQDIRQEGGVFVVDFARGKTGGVPWKFPLWPETRAALDAFARPKPRHAADGDLVFVTRHGRPWHRQHTRRNGAAIEASASVDAVAQEFDKLLGGVCLIEGKRLLKRAGLSFGTLRHSSITAVGDHPDVAAAHRVSGHVPHGTRARHYDKVPVHRLLSVTNLARQRLLRPEFLTVPETAA